MRVPSLIFVAAFALASAPIAEAAAIGDEASAVHEEPESIQIGKWAQRAVRHFPVRFYDHGHSSMSDRCDYASHLVKNILVQLGARASDFHVDACHLDRYEPTVDATFSVLVPSDKDAAPETIVVAHWQLHEWKGQMNCQDAGYIAQNVLPLFSTKDVQLLSRGDCRRDSVAVRAEFLTESPDAP